MDTPQTPSAVPQVNPYEGVTQLSHQTLDEIKENGTCLIPTIDECLADLYEKVAVSDLTSPSDSTDTLEQGNYENNHGTASDTSASTASSEEDTEKWVDAGFLIAISVILLAGILLLVREIYKGKRKMARAGTEAELERGDGAWGVWGAHEIEGRASCEHSRIESEASCPDSRSGFWQSRRPSRSALKPTRSGLPTLAVGPPARRPAPPARADSAPASPAPSVPCTCRALELFRGTEGVSLPPPVYEMARLDPLAEERLHMAAVPLPPPPRYAWEGFQTRREAGRAPVGVLTGAFF